MQHNQCKHQQFRLHSLALVLPELIGVLNHGNDTTDQRDSILGPMNKL